MKTKLIGSAATLDALIDLIMKRWCWSSVSIDDSGAVVGPKGLIDGLRVVKSRGRFRLEMVTL